MICGPLPCKLRFRVHVVQGQDHNAPDYSPCYSKKLTGVSTAPSTISYANVMSYCHHAPEAETDSPSRGHPQTQWRRNSYPTALRCPRQCSQRWRGTLSVGGDDDDAGEYHADNGAFLGYRERDCVGAAVVTVLVLAIKGLVERNCLQFDLSERAYRLCSARAASAVGL